MDYHSIDKAIIFPCPNINVKEKPYKEDNLQLLEISKTENKVIPFMLVHPYLDDMQYLEKYSKKFLGFKMYSYAKNMNYRYDSSIEQQQMRFILNQKKPIIFHIGKHEGERPKDLMSIIEYSEDTPIIVAHAGKLFNDDLRAICNYKNVYIEVSPLKTMLENPFFLANPEERDEKNNVLKMDVILDYLNELFKDRVIWGSDSPWSDNLSKKGYLSEVNVLDFMELKNMNNTFLNI